MPQHYYRVGEERLTVGVSPAGLVMIDFPIDALLDEEACLRWLEVAGVFG